MAIGSAAAIGGALGALNTAGVSGSVRMSTTKLPPHWVYNGFRILPLLARKRVLA